MLAEALRIAAGRRTVVRDQLFECVRIQSQSGDPAYAPQVRQCADWYVARLQELGFEARLIFVDGFPNHPLVYATFRHSDPEKPWVFLYAHGDVQPADPLGDWISPPFEPEERDGKYFGRGMVDDKGQFATHLGAFYAAKQAGGIPCSYTVVIEFQEESGGGAYQKFMNDPANRDLLRADVAVISDTEMHAPGVPALDWGLRGINAMELEIFGPAKELHSGQCGGAVMNPLQVLCDAMARTVDLLNNVITVPGFYDDLQEPTTGEVALMSEFPPDADQILKDAGCPKLWEATGHTLAEALWHRPTCEINGIVGGYQGAGPKTIIPSRALAKITTRLGPGQNPRRCFEVFRAHFASFMPPHVRWELRYDHGCPAFVLDPTSAAAALAKRALAAGCGNPAKLSRSGGSIPAAGLIALNVRVPVLMMGYGLPGSCIHSPNEWIGAEAVAQGTDSNLQFMYAVGDGGLAASVA